MNKVLKMKPTDQAVLTATEGNDEGEAQQLPPHAANPDTPIAHVLRTVSARMEAETQAQRQARAEVDELMHRLIENNMQKKEMYRRHAEARLERQADNTVKSQMEADERERLLDEERNIFYEIRGKLQGDHPFPIFLPGEKPVAPSRPPKRRSWLRRKLGF